MAGAFVGMTTKTRRSKNICQLTVTRIKLTVSNTCSVHLWSRNLTPQKCKIMNVDCVSLLSIDFLAYPSVRVWFDFLTSGSRLSGSKRALDDIRGKIWDMAIFTAKCTSLRESTSFELFCVEVGWGSSLTPRAERGKVRKSREECCLELGPPFSLWYTFIGVCLFVAMNLKPCYVSVVLQLINCMDLPPWQLQILLNALPWPVSVCDNLRIVWLIWMKFSWSVDFRPGSNRSLIFHAHNSWQWLTFCDPRPTWPIIQLTRMTRDPWPSPRP